MKTTLIISLLLVSLSPLVFAKVKVDDTVEQFCFVQALTFHNFLSQVNKDQKNNTHKRMVKKYVFDKQLHRDFKQIQEEITAKRGKRADLKKLLKRETPKFYQKFKKKNPIYVKNCNIVYKEIQRNCKEFRDDFEKYKKCLVDYAKTSQEMIRLAEVVPSFKRVLIDTMFRESIEYEDYKTFSLLSKNYPKEFAAVTNINLFVGHGDVLLELVKRKIIPSNMNILQDMHWASIKSDIIYKYYKTIPIKDIVNNPKIVLNFVTKNSTYGQAISKIIENLKNLDVKYMKLTEYERKNYLGLTVQSNKEDFATKLFTVTPKANIVNIIDKTIFKQKAACNFLKMTQLQAATTLKKSETAKLKKLCHKKAKRRW